MHLRRRSIPCAHTCVSGEMTKLISVGAKLQNREIFERERESATSAKTNRPAVVHWHSFFHRSHSFRRAISLSGALCGPFLQRERGSWLALRAKSLRALSAALSPRSKRARERWFGGPPRTQGLLRGSGVEFRASSRRNLLASFLYKFRKPWHWNPILGLFLLGIGPSVCGAFVWRSGGSCLCFLVEICVWLLLFCFREPGKRAREQWRGDRSH